MPQGHQHTSIWQGLRAWAKGTCRANSTRIASRLPSQEVFVIGFCIFVTLFLFSMLIAQLNQAYQHGFEDMLGYARLNRAQHSAWGGPRTGNSVVRLKGFT